MDADYSDEIDSIPEDASEILNQPIDSVRIDAAV